ncbi:MAG: hypothetical protein PHV16_00490 [Candidatus Nanoarchaeia archaeon]|nr:hypothetical protein [Candidatus Nanoarchaeia archaeon]
MKRIKKNKKTIVNYFSDAFILIKKNPLYFFIPVLIDITFIFAFFFVYHFFLSKIMNNFFSLLMMTGNSIQGIIEESPESVLLMHQMNSAITTIIWWVIGLIISAYFIYSIFQSASWFFAGKIVHKKLMFWHYIKKFFAVHIIWHIAFILISYFYVRSVLLTDIFKISSSLGYVRPISMFFIIILTYFSLISYALIAEKGFRKSIKGCFVIGFKRFFILICFFAVFAVIFLIIDILLRIIFLISDSAMLIIGIIIIFPIITYFRIVLISLIKDFSR